jgi:two-component system OmpR family response regulator
MTAIRLLVVDDDPMQLELIQRGLSHEGFEVRVAASFADLVIEARRFEPGLVLLDVNMPDAPDQRMIDVVRDSAPCARVMLYSAWEDAKLRVLVGQLGADGFISKSESVVALGRRLHELQKG